MHVILQIDVKNIKPVQNCRTTLYTFYSMSPGQFYMVFCRLLIFFEINFSKNYFRNTIRVSNRLDPDQTRRFVGA